MPLSTKLSCVRSAFALPLTFFFFVGCGGAPATGLFEAGGGGGHGHDAGTPEDAPAGDASSGMDASGDSALNDALADHTGDKDTGAHDSGHDTGPPLPPVYCGTTTCPANTADCCVGAFGYPPSYTCQNPAEPTGCMMSNGIPVSCDQGADCPGGICCGTKNAYQTQYQYVKCQTTCDTGGGQNVVFCSPTASPSECKDGTSCQMSSLLPGYWVCL